jgi:hypothetical protein
MSNKVPEKPRAKAVRAHERAPSRQQSETIDWLGLWAISLGIAALVLAWVAYHAIGDTVGASFILAGAAALIALILTASERGHL